MNTLKIIEDFKIEIDQIDDNVLFELSLFNEGKYDKEELRTIVRNTGAKLNIVNNLSHKITLNNLCFGIIKNNKLIHLYTSSSFNDILPITLDCSDHKSFYFYGSQIKSKLEQHLEEDGVFIFIDKLNNKHYKSSNINGALLEEKLTYLEDGEIANLGNSKYIILDHEIKL